MSKRRVVDATEPLSFQIGTTNTGRPVIDIAGNKLVFTHATGKGKNRVLHFGSVPATVEEITISDKRCVDCGGTVTPFGIPDKVWDGLGFQCRRQSQS